MFSAANTQSGETSLRLHSVQKSMVALRGFSSGSLIRIRLGRRTANPRSGRRAVPPRSRWRGAAAPPCANRGRTPPCAASIRRWCPARWRGRPGTPGSRIASGAVVRGVGRDRRRASGGMTVVRYIFRVRLSTVVRSSTVLSRFLSEKPRISCNASPIWGMYFSIYERFLSSSASRLRLRT